MELLARLLTSTPEGATDYVQADLNDPDTVLREARRTLDFDKPVAVTMLGIVHFILDDENARAVVRQLVDALPSGSYLTIAHGCHDINRGRGGRHRRLLERARHPEDRLPQLDGDRTLLRRA